MNATDIAAWVGAITGSCIFLWDIFKWLHGGARVIVSASPNMIAYGAAVAIAGDTDSVVVEATNIGDAKTTITHLVGFYYDSWLKRLFRLKPTKSFFVFNPGPGTLPHVLDRGERWLGLMEQNKDLQRMSTEGYVYVGVFHSTTKRPIVARLVIRKAN